MFFSQKKKNYRSYLKKIIENNQKLIIKSPHHHQPKLSLMILSIKLIERNNLNIVPKIKLDIKYEDKIF